MMLIILQLSGINAVMYYSSTIFEFAGVSNNTSATIGMMTLNVGMTVVSIWLIDRLGRRPLLLGGTTIMTVALIIAGLALIVLNGSCNIIRNRFQTNWTFHLLRYISKNSRSDMRGYGVDLRRWICCWIGSGGVAATIRGLPSRDEIKRNGTMSGCQWCSVPLTLAHCTFTDQFLRWLL